MLDVSIRTELLRLMLDLRQERGLTYLFITHDLSLAWVIADRIAVMYLGKIMEIGPADQVIRAPRHPYTQALVSVPPSPDPPAPGERQKRTILVGETPDAAHVPSGCRFHPRCPLASTAAGWRSRRSSMSGAASGRVLAGRRRPQLAGDAGHERNGAGHDPGRAGPSSPPPPGPPMAPHPLEPAGIAALLEASLTTIEAEMPPWARPRRGDLLPASGAPMRSWVISSRQSGAGSRVASGSSSPPTVRRSKAGINRPWRPRVTTVSALHRSSWLSFAPLRGESIELIVGLTPADLRGPASIPRLASSVLGTSSGSGSTTTAITPASCWPTRSSASGRRWATHDGSATWTPSRGRLPRADPLRTRGDRRRGTGPSRRPRPRMGP